MTEPGRGPAEDRDGVEVRLAEPTDAEQWIRLRTALWPEDPADHPVDVERYFATRPQRTATFVAIVGERTVGFAEVGLRDYAEDCRSSPVGYLEGIYVEPSLRQTGVGRALVGAGEAWARARGCTEMASDRALDNEGSGRFHESIGFEETVRLVAYRKDL